MTPVQTLRVDFKFMLSDKMLWRCARILQVRNYDLAAIESAQTLTLTLATPTDVLSKGSSGFLMRSMPIGAGIVPGMQHSQPMLCYVMQCFPRYYVDMAQSFEDYKSKFSAKTRATLTRKVRKFAEHCGGNLSWRAFSRADEVAEFFRLARIVSARTYQERLLDAGLPDSRSFLAEAECLAAAGQFRAYLLFDGELPVSYLYCPVRSGIVGYDYLGYDPAYLKHSVGTVLQWLALESLFAEGGHMTFDFTEGESEHKKLFSTHKVDCANIAFLRPGFRNLLLVQCHHAFHRSVEALGNWLERHHLKSRIRRWLRFGRIG